MNWKKLFNKKGQTLVLFALVIPLLFLFVGVALDLGWYYLNVSRLQNAADATALAGAQYYVKNDPNYKSVNLVSKYPANNFYEIDEECNKQAILYTTKNLSETDKYNFANDKYFVIDAWDKSSYNIVQVQLVTCL